MAYGTQSQGTGSYPIARGFALTALIALVILAVLRFAFANVSFEAGIR